MDKIFNLIGLATRARKIISGEELMDAIRKKKVSLVILASDASENTRKRYSDKCSFYGIDLITVENSFKLNQAIGKANRMAIGINDEGFKKSIMKCWKGQVIDMAKANNNKNKKNQKKGFTPREKREEVEKKKIHKKLVTGFHSGYNVLNH